MKLREQWKKRKNSTVRGGFRPRGLIVRTPQILTSFLAACPARRCVCVLWSQRSGERGRKWSWFGPMYARLRIICVSASIKIKSLMILACLQRRITSGQASHPSKEATTLTIITTVNAVQLFNDEKLSIRIRLLKWREKNQCPGVRPGHSGGSGFRGFTIGCCVWWIFGNNSKKCHWIQVPAEVSLYMRVTFYFLIIRNTNQELTATLAGFPVWNPHSGFR